MSVLLRGSNIRLGFVGLAVLAAAFTAAQVATQVTGADRVLLLQAKRFEGTYKLPTGETSVKINDNSADWTVSSGTNNFSASLAPKAGKPDRATLSLDGKTIEGKATIDGKTLTMEFAVDKTKYFFKLTLSGRNEGDLSVKKGDANLVSGAVKRA